MRPNLSVNTDAPPAALCADRAVAGHLRSLGRTPNHPPDEEHHPHRARGSRRVVRLRGIPTPRPSPNPRPGIRGTGTSSTQTRRRTNFFGRWIQLRRSNLLFTDDLLCRSHLLPSELPRHKDGWRPRRNPVRKPMVQMKSQPTYRRGAARPNPAVNTVFLRRLR